MNISKFKPIKNAYILPLYGEDWPIFKGEFDDENFSNSLYNIQENSLKISKIYAFNNVRNICFDYNEVVILLAKHKKYNKLFNSTLEYSNQNIKYSSYEKHNILETINKISNKHKPII